MDRLGLGYEALRARNPGIILCSISGFGQTGPNAKRPGYAHVAHAMSGWLALQFLHRDPPERPRGPGIAIGDTTTGLTAFGAVCAALFKRERTGEGEHLDIALFDSLFGSNDSSIQAELLELDQPIWYHPVHETRDGYLTANVGPDYRAWSNVCKAMGREALLDDPRFATQHALMEHIVEAAALVAEWLKTLSSSEAEQVLEAHHIPCARVLPLDEAVRQPQVAARDLAVELDDPLYGPSKVVNSAFRYAGSDCRPRSAAPTLGQHHDEVLADWLAMDQSRIDALRAADVFAERRS